MDAMDYEFEEERAAFEARRDEEAYFDEMQERMAAELAPVSPPAPAVLSTAALQRLLTDAFAGVPGFRLVTPARRVDHLVRGSR